MKPFKTTNKLTYDQQKSLLGLFLKSFQDCSINQNQQCYRKYGKKKYLIEMLKIANKDRKVMEVLIEDLQFFFKKDDELQMVRGFRYNTLRYLGMFQRVIAQIMPVRTKQLTPQQLVQQKYTGYLKHQRKSNLLSDNHPLKAWNQQIPYKIHTNFDVSIVFGPACKVPVKTISQVKAENIGELIITKAIVVRSSEVRPELLVGTYACDICGSENYQEVYDSSYKPMLECKSIKCKQNKVNGKLTFLPGHSKFRAFQELKIQQTPEQLLRGAIPKSTYLQLRGKLINNAHPGDIIKVQGIVLPKQRKKNQIYKDLFFDSYIYVTKIVREKKKYVDLDISQEMRQNVLNVKQQMGDDQLYLNLAKSIAPEIYGMQSVKKALLLQMAGGVTTQTQDHLRIRGQINIALFGDPGIAKSQLLKHISYISPRAVYTTGKGSSGVGLTAAIVTDPATRELSLEAGALVLADMGVCCIDQFDKMDEYDRTAIHEVMEQQTVSITKAGIITTLNARTAVLAAANPMFGRYNRKETTQKNLNLPAALLSRFDLIFILLDVADKKKDLQLARHIGSVHQKKKAPRNGQFDQKFLKTYIAMCKQYSPTIPLCLNEELIKKYIDKRQIQMDASQEGESYTTLRSLLALIRLSQARAKLRFSNQVSMSDVLQSLQIVSQSQANLNIQGDKRKVHDSISAIYDQIKTMCSYTYEKRVQRDKLFARAISRGYSSLDIQNTITNYVNLGVIVQEQEWIKMID